MGADIVAGTPRKVARNKAQAASLHRAEPDRGQARFAGSDRQVRQRRHQPLRPPGIQRRRPAQRAAEPELRHLGVGDVQPGQDRRRHARRMLCRLPQRCDRHAEQQRPAAHDVSGGHARAPDRPGRRRRPEAGGRFGETSVRRLRARILAGRTESRASPRRAQDGIIFDKRTQSPDAVSAEASFANGAWSVTLSRKLAGTGGAGQLRAGHPLHGLLRHPRRPYRRTLPLHLQRAGHDASIPAPAILSRPKQ